MEHAGDRAATNRTAIVTGAASGIGRALAEALAEAGIEVVLADRQTELAAEVASGICTKGGVAIAADLDVRDADRFRDLVKSTVARTGRLDYLFNNAGIGVGGEMKEFEPADWDDVIDVNLRGVAYGILAAYPVMIRQGFGHIVNTASMAGLISAPFQISYTATKHAVVGLSRALRLEAKRYGVRVSLLCPGLIRTPILSGGRYGAAAADGRDGGVGGPGRPPAVGRKVGHARPQRATIVRSRVNVSGGSAWFAEVASVEACGSKWQRFLSSFCATARSAARRMGRRSNPVRLSLWLTSNSPREGISLRITSRPPECTGASAASVAHGCPPNHGMGSSISSRQVCSTMTPA